MMRKRLWSSNLRALKCIFHLVVVLSVIRLAHGSILAPVDQVRKETDFYSIWLKVLNLRGRWCEFTQHRVHATYTEHHTPALTLITMTNCGIMRVGSKKVMREYDAIVHGDVPQSAFSLKPSSTNLIRTTLQGFSTEQCCLRGPTDAGQRMEISGLQPPTSSSSTSSEWCRSRRASSTSLRSGRDMPQPDWSDYYRIYCLLCLILVWFALQLCYAIYRIVSSDFVEIAT